MCLLDLWTHLIIYTLDVCSAILTYIEHMQTKRMFKV